MLEKLEILEVDEEDTSALRLKFPPSPRSGNYPVIVEDVAKAYGDHVVFRNANLTIEISTNAKAGRDDYAALPAFRTWDSTPPWTTTACPMSPPSTASTPASNATAATATCTS